MRKEGPAAIADYLRSYGWSFDQTERGLVRTGWQGQRHFFPLEINSSSTTIRLSVRPLLAIAMDCWDPKRFHRRLLEFNRELNVAKISLDQHGDIVLGIDIIVRQLNYQVFEEALGILGYYADVLAEEIVAICDQSAASLNKLLPRH